MADIKKQSFWAKPEGTTGMVVGVGILGGIGWLAHMLLPPLIEILQNAIYAGCLGVVGLILLYVFVLDSRLRDAAWLKYTLAMERVTYSIIKEDPFGVLRATQKVAKQQTEEAAEQCTQVKSQATIIEGSLNRFKAEQTKLKDEANWMRTHGSPQDEVQNHLMRIGKLEEAIGRTSNSFKMITGLYDQLNRAKKAFQVIDSNIDFEISFREEEYKGLVAANNAVSIFRRALRGNDKNLQLRNQAMAFVNQDYSEKLGRVGDFMDEAKLFLDNADMQNDMSADKGLKLLEDLNSRDLNVGLLQAPSAVPISKLSTIDYFSKK
jgi:flagellar biosynthesis chaperone FliJ